MSENNTEVVAQTQVENTENSTPQYSDVELKAMEMGWRPKEEFDGADEDFIDAKEFIGRRPLFEKIEHQSKEVKAVRRALEEFKQHYAKVEEAAYKRAIDELKTKQKEAFREGDVDQFYAIQEELDSAKEQVQALKEAQSQPVQQEVAPEFKEWVSKNPWYTKEEHMKVFADKYGMRLASQGVSPEKVLKEVEKAVRAEFPNKFKNPNQDRPSAVEGKGGSGGSKSKGGDYSLDDRERKIMNDLVRAGVITKEQYIADLRKAKGE